MTKCDLSQEYGLVQQCCRNGQADSKVHMKMHETQNSQNNLETEELSWRIYTSQF